MTAIPDAQLTHLGIFVHDPDRMVAFYTNVFGMVVSDQGDFQGKHLTFLTGSQGEHHQVVFVRGRTGEPTTKVLGQVSFRVGSLDDLRTFVDERLAGYKRPRRYELRDELRRTDAGKLLKRVLRDEFWAGQGRSV